MNIRLSTAIIICVDLFEHNCSFSIKSVITCFCYSLFIVTDVVSIDKNSMQMSVIEGQQPVQDHDKSLIGIEASLIVVFTVLQFPIFLVYVLKSRIPICLD